MRYIVESKNKKRKKILVRELRYILIVIFLISAIPKSEAQRISLKFGLAIKFYWNAEKTNIDISKRDSSSSIYCNSYVDFYENRTIKIEMFFLSNAKKKIYNLTWNKTTKHITEGSKTYYIEYTCTSKNDSYEYVVDVYKLLENNNIVQVGIANIDEIYMLQKRLK